jgi:hypothetical protein
MRTLNVFGLRPLFPDYDFENDLLTFVQGFEAFAEDGRVMNEDILAAFLGNESQTLLIVPPFNFAFRHKLSPACLERAWAKA